MFGGAIPNLSETPCASCGASWSATELTGEGVVWDPYHLADRQLAALPYHARCATTLLPPAEPSADMRTCGRCGEEIAPEDFAPAFQALHARFSAAKGSLATPQVAWRLAEREPARRYRAEHFACILNAIQRPPPGLPPSSEPEA